MSMWEFATTVKEEYERDDVDALAAALAYYATFSIVPMMLIAVAIGGLFFGAETTQQELVGQLTNLLGESGAAFVAEAVENSRGLGQRANIAASLVGLVLAVFGATKFFTRFQQALNRVWNVEPDENAGIKQVFRKRAASFGLLVVLGLLMIVSTVASALIAGFVDAVSLPGGETMAHFANATITLLVTAILFAIVYKYFPDAEVKWRDVRVGAAVTAVMLLLGKTAIGLYVANGSFTSTYGGAASIIVFLLWVYYSMQIVLIGAEFTQVWAISHGRRILPEDHAQPHRAMLANADYSS